MFTTLINGTKMVLKIALLFFITLTTMGFIINGTADHPYSTCKSYSYVDPKTSTRVDCVTSDGKLYCDAEKQYRQLNDTLGVLKKVNTLLMELKKLQQVCGVDEGSGMNEDDTQWEEAGVKGVRIKKVEEGVAAKPRNGSMVDGALVVEL